jgi:ATP-dependent 26S proteasome regulatory subunit
MVGLPSVENRGKILRTLLGKEKVDKEIDFKELATMTEGNTGSDLKVFCLIFSDIVFNGLNITM